MTELCNIALSSNERYMPGALVAAAGVAVYAKPDTPLHFHLFTEGVKDATFKHFASTLHRLHPKSKVTRHECNEDILKGLPYWAGSRMAAVRCHYASLMPDVDWCLYLDCDILYLASVEEHFSYRDESVYACVVQEESVGCRKAESKWILENCGVEVSDSEYFNSGVVLFNLAKMRADEIPGRLIKFFKDHPDVPSPDQDALNAVLVGRTRFIPPKFDRLQIFLTDDKLAERPVVHYVCGNPWLPKYGCVANGRFRLWHRFADKYIWGKRGESYRRLFTFKVLAAKYLCWQMLRVPFIGCLFARALSKMGFTENPDDWRRGQVLHDCSADAVKKVHI